MKRSPKTCEDSRLYPHYDPQYSPPPKSINKAQASNGWRTTPITDFFLGEFSARLPGECSKDQGGLWPDLKHLDDQPDSILNERLMFLEACGYGLGLVWPEALSLAWDDPITDRLKRHKRQSLVRYTGWHISLMNAEINRD